MQVWPELRLEGSLLRIACLHELLHRPLNRAQPERSPRYHHDSSVQLRPRNGIIVLEEALDYIIHPFNTDGGVSASAVLMFAVHVGQFPRRGDLLNPPDGGRMCVFVCVFTTLLITAQPGPVILFLQCYRYGPTLRKSVVRTAATAPNKTRQREYALSLCICMCIFIKLHINAEHSPVILVFGCYNYRPTLWGISGYNSL